jgi:hypothetical protein
MSRAPCMDSGFGIANGFDSAGFMRATRRFSDEHKSGHPEPAVAVEAPRFPHRRVVPTHGPGVSRKSVHR